VRAALRKAERTVFIIGWDIDSRCRLVGDDCEPDDGLPAHFSEFLSALVSARPELMVHLLLWDYSMVYALERELFPTLSLHWNTPRQVRLCLDDDLPLGASQHQKIIVVDDAVAFSGGLDLTIRRWDTSDHTPDNPKRVDPAGQPYAGFHDVQALVDGPAAQSLAALARARWAHASLDFPTDITPIGDPWPDHVEPDLRDVSVGIARTVPASDGQHEVREVEALFHDSIRAARRMIYIENQFVTCTKVAEQFARTLRERPELEAVIVAPRRYHSWIESRAMRGGRIQFINLLREAGVANRMRLVGPEVQGGGQTFDTMVHSKVCVIDDCLLRIGSANLNNRSMGTDTECDLAFEAADAKQRAQIAHVRNRLLADHCGATAADIARAVHDTGSLIGAAEAVSRNGHRLRAIDDGRIEDVSTTISDLADPDRPLEPEFTIGGVRTRLSRLQMFTLLKIAFATILVLALPLAWQYTPLSQLAAPDAVRSTLLRLADNHWTPFAVVAVYIVAGLLAFPVTVLIAVTAATFGPLAGFVYASAGALASALVVYGIGVWAGKDAVRDLLGPRLDRIRRRIVAKGVIAVAMIRLVPVAPFTLVNLVAGASQIRLHDYVIGTILGMAPGLVVMSALGHQVFQILTQPTAGNVALLGACILGWIALSLGIQFVVSKIRRAEP
jgi:phosphatidylserine/phosphatidylglycerophosphate/cardiolipin synthase-like enzyme/uncharacterized membrane protein YdjX (TVP38/TMEM64 family)